MTFEPTAARASPSIGRRAAVRSRAAMLCEPRSVFTADLAARMSLRNHVFRQAHNGNTATCERTNRSAMPRRRQRTNKTALVLTTLVLHELRRENLREARSEAQRRAARAVTLTARRLPGAEFVHGEIAADSVRGCKVRQWPAL